MYLPTDKIKIRSDFKIFEENSDCIMNFFSLDLVKEIGFNQALYALYPESYNQIFYSMLYGNFSEGNILPFSKYSPIIMHIPYKRDYKDIVDVDLLKTGLIKFSENYKKLKISKISIQENHLIKEKIINDIIQDLDFPDIMYFR
jgi:hypothetical protein